MNLDNTFFGAYLKVNRANHHISTLLSLTDPLSPQFYDFGWREATDSPCGVHMGGVSPNPNARMRELAYVPKQPISQLLALVIGDAVHNLRAALDYAATAVVRATGGDTRFVTFPFHETRENLEPKQSGIRAIQTALPDAEVLGFFRDTIKSYNGGNTDLWTLTKIDKIDKHNFILPAVSIAGVKHTNSVTVAGNTLALNSMYGDANAPLVLYRMPVSDEDARKYEVAVSVEVLFPEGEFFSGLPVIPTLSKLSQAVIETLMSFEEFAVEAGAPVGVQRAPA